VKSWERLREAWVAGMPLDEICVTLGYSSPNTVCSIACQRKFPKRHGHRRRNARIDKIAKLFHANISYAEMAQRLGYANAVTMMTICHQIGLTRGKSKGRRQG
jgi:hypothetical protein